MSNNTSWIAKNPDGTVDEHVVGLVVAAFGAAVAASDRRVVIVTGDGSHQLTAQEISQFGRRGLKSIVFVLNNSGYLIE